MGTHNLKLVLQSGWRLNNSNGKQSRKDKILWSMTLGRWEQYCSFVLVDSRRTRSLTTTTKRKHLMEDLSISELLEHPVKQKTFWESFLSQTITKELWYLKWKIMNGSKWSLQDHSTCPKSSEISSTITKILLACNHPKLNLRIEKIKRPLFILNWKIQNISRTLSAGIKRTPTVLL